MNPEGQVRDPLLSAFIPMTAAVSRHQRAWTFGPRRTFAIPEPPSCDLGNIIGRKGKATDANAWKRMCETRTSSLTRASLGRTRIHLGVGDESGSAPPSAVTSLPVNSAEDRGRPRVQEVAPGAIEGGGANRSAGVWRAEEQRIVGRAACSRWFIYDQFEVLQSEED